MASDQEQNSAEYINMYKYKYKYIYIYTNTSIFNNFILLEVCILVLQS